jgi:hypothetical protein
MKIILSKAIKNNLKNASSEEAKHDEIKTHETLVK